eukprot:TRINITY_DN8391_c0_g2_i2.p1 TRINITY_DN8391_c0_g2~~TRINITY_DN8391_c0_g2_i2.p1  ORF type:complete len:703 (+),score=52.73 TRINITY_DN8391_c0_g2_i2:113-2110(+)
MDLLNTSNAAPGSSGFEFIAWCDYDGKELACNGSEEIGYLCVSKGDHIKLLSLNLFNGHWMNRSRFYVFGAKLTGDNREQEQGWMPASCFGFERCKIIGNYNGVEVAANGFPEQGYLGVTVGDLVTLVGLPEPGHATNRSWQYAFGTKADGTTGWFPTSCLESVPLPCSQSLISRSFHLGSRAGRRHSQYVTLDGFFEHPDSDSEINSSEHATTDIGELKGTSAAWAPAHCLTGGHSLVTARVQAFLGESLFRYRAICRGGHRCITVSPVCLQVNMAALFDESAVPVIARCLGKLHHVKQVRVPMGGGSIQRRRALLTIQSLNASAPRQVTYILKGFFGFFDAENEAEEMTMLQNLRDRGVDVVSECAIEFQPGAAGRVFVTDLLERCFMQIPQTLRVSFSGGDEVMSFRLTNLGQESFQILRINYQVVVASDPWRRQPAGEHFAHIPPLEDRIRNVLVTENVPLDVVVAPGCTTLPNISIPLKHMRFWSEEGGDDRPSLFQRVQLFGYYSSLASESVVPPEVALMTTGWLHVAGPDGSDGATIVGDISMLDFGPMEELVQRVTRLQSLDRDVLACVQGHQAFVRTSHAMQFRTMSCGQHFRSIVHVYTGHAAHVCQGFPKVDAFVLGSPRQNKHAAREAAATAALSLLDRSMLSQPYRRPFLGW